LKQAIANYNDCNTEVTSPNLYEKLFVKKTAILIVLKYSLDVTRGGFMKCKVTAYQKKERCYVQLGFRTVANLD